ILLQYMCEAIDKFLVEENPDLKLFKVFRNILHVNTEKSLFAVSGFSLEVLDITGHLPNLSESIISDDILTAEGIYAPHNDIGYISQEGSNSNGIITEAINLNIYKTQKFILEN